MGGALTPEPGVRNLPDDPAVIDAIRAALLARAGQVIQPGREQALGNLIDDIFDDWATTVEEQTSGGSVFNYARGTSPHHLLHMPLARELDNLPNSHRRFVAGRSMRDVEAVVSLKVQDPWGMPIADADDV